MILTWILLAIIWLMSVMGAFALGRYSLREEIKDEQVGEANDALESPHIESYSSSGPMGAMGPRGLDGTPGEQGPPGPGVNEARLDNGQTVQEFATHVLARLTRVERKAGMSV